MRFFGETEKLRCVPWWNGQGPRQSEPTRLSVTCSPMIWTMSAPSRTRSTSSSGIMWRLPTSSGKLRDRDACPTLVPRAKAERLHACVLAEHLGDARAQCPRALAVDDAQRLEVCAHGGIDRLHDDVLDVTHALAAKVDLARDVLLGQVADHGDDLAGSGFLFGRAAQGGQRQGHLHT